MEYTLRELFDRLKIPLAELARRADVSEVTAAKIRDGYSARRSSINSLLEVFSELYGVKLSIDNVSGIIIKDKLARQEQQVQESKPLITEKVIEGPVLTVTSDTATPKKKPSEGRRKAKKGIPLPEGAILASEFAESHSVKRRTFIDHMTKGLGPGLIGESTDMIPQRDQVDYSERPNPGREHTGEKEKYLTADQQRAARDFWDRHHVDYSMCDRAECPCHKGE